MRSTVLYVIGGASGVVFAVVVILWVAYVVPLTLRRYDEASESVSLGSFSSLSRVIRRGRTAVHDDQASDAEVEESSSDESKVEAPVVNVAPRPVNRAAARLAARRRRRVLLTLLFALAVVGGLGVAGIIAQMWTAIPGGLLVAWLVACRVQVRGELGLRTPSVKKPRVPRVRLPRRRAAASGDAPARSTSADEEETIVVSHQFEDIEPDRPRTMEKDSPLAVDALDEQLQIAVPSVATTGETLWDPLPVTLPTYVTKPRVGRTVRTIDFTQAGTWSSGHVEAEGVELPAKRDAEAVSEDEGHEPPQAVGH